MSPSARFAAVVALAVATTPVVAQRDVSLDALVRASENRIAIYARSARTGDELAFNADVPFPAGALAALPSTAAAFDAASRPVDDAARAEALRPLFRAPPSDAAPPTASARAAVAACVALRAASERGDAVARAFGEASQDAFGGGLSPFVETGSFPTRVLGAPGVSGFAALPRGDVFVCVLTQGFRDPAGAEALLPVVVAACVRRLGAGFVEPEAATAPVADERFVLAATLHDAARDAALFEATDDLRRRASDRLGRQTSAFKLGETARVAVVVAPDARARVAVQWILPGRADARRTSQAWVDARVASDRTFDLPLSRTGAYRVRVVVDGALALDRAFFVTVP